jgi:glycosyltransferase involved in cell wall biosynthesis
MSIRRVVVLCPHYPPQPGGVSDYARQWARAIAARGVEVVVLTDPAAHVQDPGVEVIGLPEGWGIGGMGALRRAIAARSPDAVLLHYVPHLYQRQGASLVINHALAGLEAPLVTLAHELYYGRHEGLKVQPVGWLQRYALLPLFAASRRVVLTVPDRLARMQALFPWWRERFTLLPVGGNLAPAERMPGDELTLLFLGLAHPSKELGLLAHTLDTLAAAGVPARLLLAGGAQLEHPHAVNLGYLDAPEAARMLASADLFLLPLADGASTRRTSLMNALAAGLPVVSTAGANTDRALFAGGIALADDAEAFARMTLDLARDPASRAALGEAGRRLYEANFSWDVLATRWLALLDELKTR